MLIKTAFLLLNSSMANVSAQPLDRDNITSCAYQAGTAYEIQQIRHKEGHNWEEFEANIRKIYSESQGRKDLLAIAGQVFIQPVETDADTIHDQIFDACVQRQQGTEPLT
ncbi:hypothetical protein [Methylophaga sp.]|uniref:hypothetical protein n=1 Tax=Methylophaga sp. TaxID=2024840 RepID=UPI001400EE2D|nr:hypothetical protein [Methylophaga sp.]MTI63894.1 hypothetical protein [Methylophaga sp.]